MPSPVLHSDAAAGIATITAVAALGNARPLPGTKTVVLDAQIYVGSPSRESLMGSLRFFNASDMVFEHESALYLIYATFARMEDGIDQLSVNDYDFIGDLQWLIPLGAQSNCVEDYQIDPCQRAYVHVSGAVNNVHQESGTFKLDVDHYISASKDLPKDSKKPIKPIAPISCEFSARYQNRKKPVPFNRRYVSVSGFLTGVTYKQNSEDTVERFIVSIEHIAFLGQQGNSTSAIPNTLDTPSKTPRCGRNLIDYKRSRSTTPAVASVPSPETPATPTPNQGPSRKRQRQSAESDSSDMYMPEK